MTDKRIYQIGLTMINGVGDILARQLLQSLGDAEAVFTEKRQNLEKIPGIGSGIARLIVGYRQRLGGFYQIEQLKDINLDTRQLQAWFSIDPTNVHRINLNRTGVDRLRSHPYINFYQAKAIVEYRKKKGSLTSLKPFSLYEEFTETDLERIGHYVCFE